jgi:acyl-CoA thioesterase I
MKILLLSFISILSVCCKKPIDAEQQVRKEVERASVKTIKYLALGDSYTVGQAVSKAESFPFVLTDSLNKDPYIEVSETHVIAQTGWTTNALLGGMEEVKPTLPFDVVTLLIGVNNQYRGLSVELYKTEFKACLLKAIQFAGGNQAKVLVVSIPDYGFTPFGSANKDFISAEIDTFNKVNKSISEELNVSYVDITSISRSGVSGLVAADGLHPSGKQYQLWVDAMFDLVKMKVRLP